MRDKSIPEGFHTITPYLVVESPAKLIDFLEKAFAARTTECMKLPDGTVMHAEVLVGDSYVMIGGTRGMREPSSAMLYIYCSDCDAMYQSALRAGGISISPPADMFYGDRHGGVTDPCGNQWWVATRKETLSKEEMEKRFEAFMAKQKG